MRKFNHFFLFFVSIFLSQGLYAQISNTQTTITLTSLGSQQAPSYICNGFTPPSGTYTINISYYDLDAPDYVSTGNLSATVTNNGNSISISVPSANFPTLATTLWPYDFASTHGTLTLTGVGGGYTIMWDQSQYICGALPVTLVSFSGSKQSNNTILLTWVTADESNMTKYYIERNSANNTVTNMAIGSENAVNNTGNQTTYQFVDQYPFNGNNYYRLKMVGQNGYVKYSNVILVGCSGCTAQPPLVNCTGLNITGPYQLCSGSADFLAPELFYNTYTWSVTSDAAGVTFAGPIAKVTQYGHGTANLQVNLSRCTNATKTKTAFISVGKRIEGYFESWGLFGNLITDGAGTNYVSPGVTSVYLSQPNNEVQQWSLLWGNPVSWSSQSYGLHFNLPPNGSATFQLDINTSCGTRTELYTFIANSSYSYYSLSPNPATSEVSLYVDDEKLKKFNTGKSPEQNIQKILIVDKFGKTLVQKNYPRDTRKISVNVSALPADVYIVKVFNGKEWTSLKLQKAR